MTRAPRDREGIDGGSTRLGGSAGPLFGGEPEAPRRPFLRDLEKPRDGSGPDLERLILTWLHAAGPRGLTSLEALAIYVAKKAPSDPVHAPETFGAIFTSLAMAGRVIDAREARGGRRVVRYPTPADAFQVIACGRDSGRRTAAAKVADDAWTPTVDFDGPRLSRCSCDAMIGWIQRGDGSGRSHPVQLRGFDGVPIAKGDSAPGPYRSGWTDDGRLVRIRRDDAAPRAARVVVFESHFGHCPDAARYGGSR